jgi:thiol-disulfide isomerase/thioredoxin
MLLSPPSFGATLLRKLVLLSALALAFALQTAGAAVATNFTIVNHKTGQPLSLYDYQGTVILLDFWAYWCGPCQAAASDIEPNITKYYRNAGGNKYGVPVTVISISIDMSDPTSENNYIQTYGLELVGDDANEVAFGPYNHGYIPEFVVINGLTNSPNTGSWQVLYSQYGYTTNSTVPLLKSWIDSVQKNQQTGSLQVTINPASAITAGAQWQVDGGTLQNSGATVTNLSVGNHTVSFKTISGWTTPASQTVSITANSTATATGAYVAIAQTGSLQVTITPAGAITAGAKWQVDGGTLQNSGATVANLSVGNHTVSFTSITGWTTPASQTVSVTANSTATATGAYVAIPQTGSLQVTISPADAITAGAQWQVDGGTLQNSGVTVTGLSAGNHTVSFTTISGWTMPTNQTVSVYANSTTPATGTYLAILPTGSLQVTISPAGAIAAGAQWQVDGGPLQNSGATVTNLSVGNHTVSFTTTIGWTTPPNQTVYVSANSTATAVGVHVQQTGSLQVTISPAGAITAGARWQVDGGTWQNSGATVTNLSVANHTVSFNTISGWTTPANQTVYVTASSTATASATYVAIPQIGSLQVTISPASAVTAGAQWQVDGGTWQTSGATVTNLSVANHTVSFSTISGWTTPASQTVFVSANSTATASATYVAIPQTGSLQVTISPASAVTAGAQWQVDGGTWQTSGTTVTNLSAANHTVSFNTISGWTTPTNQTVSVSANSTAQANGAYVLPQTGSLQVTISPAGAITAGAKWQVDGGTLQTSGATVTNLSAGDHTVSFNFLSGWNTPATQVVKITNATTTKAAGVYTQEKLSLTITSPKSSQSVSNAAFTVTGMAKDNVAVAAVYYQLNSNGWTTASSTNAWTNWMAGVTLIPGTNTLCACAVDTSGNLSPTNAVKFKFIPSATLVVLTNGNGAFTPKYNGALLAINTNYTLTAAAGKNWIFSNWVGGTTLPYSVLASSSNYTFTMQSNLVLQANFVTNFFLTAQGAYNGLFTPASSPRQQTNSGFFTVNVTSTGGLSGNLFLGSETIPLLNEKFDVSGAAQLHSTRKGQSTLTTTLQLNLADRSVQGTVTDGSFAAVLSGDQAVFSSTHKATNYQGQYTLIIPGTDNPMVGPFGTSYGTATVDALGNITFGGSLADGTSVSRSSVVSKDGFWPFYVPLYGGAGSLWGWNYFTNHTIISAPYASWINATNSAKTAVYRSGFTNEQVAIIGSFYTSTNKPLLSLTNAQVLLEEISPPFSITDQITLASNNAIKVTNAAGKTNKLTLTIKTSGLITGSFLNPANAKQTIQVNGVLLQNQTNAQGYFLGTNQSGTFILAPLE